MTDKSINISCDLDLVFHSSISNFWAFSVKVKFFSSATVSSHIFSAQIVSLQIMSSVSSHFSHIGHAISLCWHAGHNGQYFLAYVETYFVGNLNFSRLYKILQMDFLKMHLEAYQFSSLSTISLGICSSQKVAKKNTQNRPE